MKVTELIDRLTTHVEVRGDGDVGALIANMYHEVEWETVVGVEPHPDGRLELNFDLVD